MAACKNDAIFCGESGDADGPRPVTRLTAEETIDVKDDEMDEPALVELVWGCDAVLLGKIL